MKRKSSSTPSIDVIRKITSASSAGMSASCLGRLLGPISLRRRSKEPDGFGMSLKTNGSPKKLSSFSISCSTHKFRERTILIGFVHRFYRSCTFQRGVSLTRSHRSTSKNTGEVRICFRGLFSGGLFC